MFFFLLPLAFLLSAPGFGLGCPDRIALVGNPWSSAKELVQELERRGIKVHGFQSEAKIPSWGESTFHLEPDRQLLVFNGDLDVLEAEARALRPDAILYGADGDAVILVDALAERLGLAGNGTAHSAERRTKEGTQWLLEQAGMNHLPSMLIQGTPSESLKLARDFVKKVGGYPVFVKPNNDGGGTLAFRIDNEQALQAKLDLIQRSINSTTGKVNGSALIQKFATGDEFAVQGVALNGEIKFSSILKYLKAPIDENTETYQAEWIIDPRSIEGRMLMGFAESANQAVAFKNGPFHWELKLSSKGIWRVRWRRRVTAIELNPRLIGGSMLAWLKDCVGYHDAELTTEANFFPDEFHRRPKVYTVQNQGFVYEVITPKGGLRINEAALRTVAQLPGFKRQRLLDPTGGPLPQTINLDSIGASFDFAHPSKALMERVFKELQRMKKSGVFFRE